MVIVLEERLVVPSLALNESSIGLTESLGGGSLVIFKPILTFCGLL